MKIIWNLSTMMLACLALFLCNCKNTVSHTQPDVVERNIEKLLEKGEKKQAFELVNQANYRAIKRGTPQEISYTYLSKGDFQELTFHPDSAILCYYKSLDVAQKQGDSVLLYATYMRLSRSYFTERKYDSAMVFAKQAFSLQKDSVNCGKATAQMGWCYFKQKEYQKSEELFHQCLGIGTRHQDSILLASAYHGIGICEKTKGNLTASIKNYQESLKIFEKKDYKRKVMNLLILLSGEYAKSNFYEEALSALQRAFKLIEIFQDKTARANFYLHSGHVSYNLEKLDAAKIEYEKVLDLGRELQNPDILYQAYLAIGNLKLTSEHPEECFDFYQQAYELGLANPSIPNGQSAPLLGMSAVCYYTDEFDRGMHYIDVADEILKTEKNSYYEINSRMNRFSLYFKSQKYDDAERVSKEALEIAQKSDNLKLQHKAYQNLYNIARKRNDTPKVLDYLELYTGTYEAFLNQDKVMEIGKLKATIDFEKERLMNEANVSKLNKEIELRTQKWNFLVILSSFVLLFTLYLIYSGINIRRQKRELLKLNQEITHLNKNLEKIVAERTEELKKSHEKVVEMLQHNSHDLRNHVARILGLTILYKNKLADLDFIMSNIDKSAEELDKSIAEINRNLYKGT